MKTRIIRLFLFLGWIGMFNLGLETYSQAAEDWKGESDTKEISVGGLTGMGIVNYDVGFTVLGTFSKKLIKRGFIPDLNDSVSIEVLFGPSFMPGYTAWMYGAHLRWDFVKDDRLTLKLGVLVAYFSYVLSLFQPVREIADKWNTFLSGMTSAERIFSILAWPTEMEDRAIRTPAVSLPELKGHIVFENVWFAYSKENWVLKDFTLEIQPGQRVGVVGHTGAGKTTLISLLMRFYEPQKGRILIDGEDIRSYDRRSLRASIGIVQQEVFLFSGTFEENITFWRKMDSERTKFILSSLGFQRNWDDVLHERGVNLSAGERQILAFARAMVTDPKIWILDEATANMDSQTEAQIQRALNAASRERTSILIAHRLATVKSADRICVLNQGSLIETGDHETLVKQNGLYARLYRYQHSQQNAVEKESQTLEVLE